eukprot:TRINITY_DN20776_c0_g1_i1.p1 TRINITY_DN20776_c0_g1~~TRINITY_DN20776_c0_g1_i1.p1  ORF type:complete len:263 (+),score=22.04 TRINITY_DN20776_c0_g1_i1:91-879(+)
MGRHGHWQSGQWHLSASRPDLLAKPGMETWGGAPLHKTGGFWQPSSSPYATPPTSTPFFWKPDGWKQLARQKETMEETYDAWKQRSSAAESPRPASALCYGRPNSARSDATSSHASSRRRRHHSRHPMTHISSSGHARHEVAPPRRGRSRGLSRQPWTTSRADLEQTYMYYVPPSSWLDWQRSPAGSSSLEQDNPYMARTLQAHYGSAAPWPSRFAGHTLNGSFGRSDSFTNSCYFGTSGQSHNADLRRITRSSPNRVTRVC